MNTVEWKSKNENKKANMTMQADDLMKKKKKKEKKEHAWIQ